MHIFITGGAGYIGSVLVKELLQRGYELTVLDLMLFGNKGFLDLIGEKGLKIVEADVRTYSPDLVVGYDAIIDLAAISQPDPLGRIDTRMFYEINYLAPLRTAKIATKKGVKRYIFTSTCSVYGFQNKVVDETCPPNPLEDYAKTKYMAEQGIQKINGLCKTILRLATVYGYSPKMRFDLVVNAMTLTLFKYGKIRVGRPGVQRRPIVHIKDVVNAIVSVLEAPCEIVNNEIFNVGSNEQNYRVVDIAYEIFNALNKEPNIEFYGEPDTRSYVVDFSKIRQVLGFSCRYTIADGAREVYKALQEKLIDDEPWTHVIDWWYKLVNNGLIKPVDMVVNPP
ncbi:MAG: NAD(P)-dependent oxidoreductase [Ignisphaera sp.]